MVEAIEGPHDYTGEVQEEDATGRFHASLAFTRQAFEQVAGWPLTMGGDFDQQLIARLNAIGLPGDPCQLAAPAYVFRWNSTGAYHGQAFRHGPEDMEWYERVPPRASTAPYTPTRKLVDESLPMAIFCGNRDPIGQLTNERS